jgi:probable HAF family extracellular repeat protein
MDVRTNFTVAGITLAAVLAAASGQETFPFTDINGDGPGMGDNWGETEFIAPRYTVTDIGTLGGLESYCTAISNNGWIVGGAKNTLGQTKAFRFRNGEMTNLGSLPGLLYASANGVNEHGDVVGVSAAAVNLFGSTAQPWLVRNQQWLDLDPFNNGVYATAMDINSAGVVIGTNSFTGAGSVESFVWSSGLPQALNGLVGDTCRIHYGTSINDMGVSVGYSAAPGVCGDERAYVHAGGLMMELGTLGGSNSRANNINEAGEIVGFAELPTGQNRAAVWRNGQISSLGTLGGSSFAVDNNNDDVIVGYFIDNRNLQRACVWLNGNMLDLNALIDPATGWRLLIATGVNDDGYIVGQGRNPQGRLRGFVLTPPCRTDFNRDGGIDGEDVVVFFDYFSGGAPEADLNYDGGIDGADIQRFFELWEAGSC